MATFQNQRFENQDVAVDGNQYTGCAFDGCILIFEGGDVPVFNRCTFRNIKIQLKGDAAQTTNYLSVLHTSGLPEAVEHVLSDVQSGIPLLPDRPAPPPSLNTGGGQSGMLIGAGVIAIIAGWLFALYLFSWILQPMATLESGNFLETEISFDLIPVLPDTLADAYELMKDNQLEQLTVVEAIEGSEGVARIPIEDAYAIMLAEGMFPLGDDPVTGTINDDDVDNGVEDALSTEANDGSVGPVGETEADTESVDEATEDAAEGSDAEADAEDADASDTEADAESDDSSEETSGD